MKVVDPRVGKDGNIRTRDSSEYIQAIDLSIREILYPCIDGFTFEDAYLQEGNGKISKGFEVGLVKGMVVVIEVTFIAAMFPEDLVKGKHSYT
jgi:hypothetical protein